MRYYEFAFTVPEESREALTNILSEIGSEGFFEKHGDILAYFGESINPDKICDELSGFRDRLKISGLDPGFSFQWRLLPEKDWNESWKASFFPIDVGENLTIVPSWLKSDTAKVPVIIDPGMVFGTGHHETTTTCIALIEKYSHSSARKSFLDVGTGTGILAVCAGKLGFRQVTAVDTDPLAVDAARRNVLLNDLENVMVQHGDIHHAPGLFDFISANLLSNILIEIAPEISKRLNPGGTAILSGMLSGQEADVIAAYEKGGLVLKENLLSGAWVTLVFSRLPNP